MKHIYIIILSLLAFSIANSTDSLNYKISFKCFLQEGNQWKYNLRAIPGNHWGEQGIDIFEEIKEVSTYNDTSRVIVACSEQFYPNIIFYDTIYFKSDSVFITSLAPQIPNSKICNFLTKISSTVEPISSTVYKTSHIQPYPGTGTLVSKSTQFYSNISGFLYQTKNDSDTVTGNTTNHFETKLLEFNHSTQFQDNDLTEEIKISLPFSSSRILKEGNTWLYKDNPHLRKIEVLKNESFGDTSQIIIKETFTDWNNNPIIPKKNSVDTIYFLNDTIYYENHYPINPEKQTKGLIPYALKSFSSPPKEIDSGMYSGGKQLEFDYTTGYTDLIIEYSEITGFVKLTTNWYDKDKGDSFSYIKLVRFNGNTEFHGKEHVGEVNVTPNNLIKSENISIITTNKALKIQAPHIESVKILSIQGKVLRTYYANKEDEIISISKKNLPTTGVYILLINTLNQQFVKKLCI